MLAAKFLFLALVIDRKMLSLQSIKKWITTNANFDIYHKGRALCS